MSLSLARGTSGRWPYDCPVGQPSTGSPFDRVSPLVEAWAGGSRPFSRGFPALFPRFRSKMPSKSQDRWVCVCPKDLSTEMLFVFKKCRALAGFLPCSSKTHHVPGSVQVPGCQAGHGEHCEVPSCHVAYCTADLRPPPRKIC